MVYGYDLKGKDTPTSYAAMDKPRTIATFEKRFSILRSIINFFRHFLLQPSLDIFW